MNLVLKDLVSKQLDGKYKKGKTGLNHVNELSDKD